MKKCLLLGILGAALATQAAAAQPFDAGSKAKGIRGAIGLGLLGAELTMTIKAAVGVSNPWLLSLIPLAVGGGCAAGGYFLEQKSTGAGIASLAAGMTLLVPSILLTLVLLAEHEEPAVEMQRPAERAAAAGSAAPATMLPLWGSRSLVGIDRNGLRLGLPAIALVEGPAASLYQAGGTTGTGVEYRLALVHWTF